MEYKHISTAAKEALEIIDGRRKGDIYPLRCSIPKLNKAIDGFN